MRDEFTEKNYLIVWSMEPFNKLIDKVIFNFSSEFKSRVESFRNAETKRDEILGYQYFKAIFALSIA